MAVSINRASQRSGARRRSTGQAFADINVTPFVDVMLVLLVIFMVTAPMMTVGVPVDLPKTKAAKMNDQTEPLVVSVDASGKSYLQETELDGDALVERLIAVSGSNPDAKIYVRGDQKINYGRVMEIMGVIAAAGFNKVSLIAEMPSGADKGKKLTVHKPASVPPGLPTGQLMHPNSMPQIPQGSFPSMAPPSMVSQGMQPVEPSSGGVPQALQGRSGKPTSNPANGPKAMRGQ
jgi:biopolymer transport protein TolR